MRRLPQTSRPRPRAAMPFHRRSRHRPHLSPPSAPTLHSHLGTRRTNRLRPLPRCHRAIAQHNLPRFLPAPPVTVSPGANRPPTATIPASPVDAIPAPLATGAAAPTQAAAPSQPASSPRHRHAIRRSLGRRLLPFRRRSRRHCTPPRRQPPPLRPTAPRRLIRWPAALVQVTTLALRQRHHPPAGPGRTRARANPH